jgi:hypothetical protein
MIDFKSMRIGFGRTTGGPRESGQPMRFPSAVRRAEAAINGFEIGYEGNDHHLLRTRIDVKVDSVVNDTVNVSVGFSLRDSSGHFDDPYSGFVDVLVIVERDSLLEVSHT